MEEIDNFTLVKSKLSELDIYRLALVYEDHDSLRIEVTSNSFIGWRLDKRCSFLSEKLLEVCMDELAEYSVSFIPLTYNERFKGADETGK